VPGAREGGPVTIGIQAAIDAAQAYDLAHRPPARNWGRVPDDQVARLLAGAAPHLHAAWLATVTGYLIDGSVYHPADVQIIRKEDPGA
jgi:hypothetical protein